MSSDSLREKQIKLDLGQQAVLLNDLKELASINRNQISNTLGKITGQGTASDSAGNDMGDIILGDSPRTVTQSAAPSSGIPWGQLLIGAGLMATGIGAPIGLGMLVSALPKIPAAVAPAASPMMLQPALSVDMMVEPPSGASSTDQTSP